MLDEQFKTFDGGDMPGDSKRKALLNILGVAQAATGEEAIRLWEIGPKVLKIKDLSELPTDDRAFILEKVRKGVAYYPALIIAQLIKILE